MRTRNLKRAKAVTGHSIDCVVLTFCSSIYSLSAHCRLIISRIVSYSNCPPLLGIILFSYLSALDEFINDIFRLKRMSMIKSFDKRKFIWTSGRALRWGWSWLCDHRILDVMTMCIKYYAPCNIHHCPHVAMLSGAVPLQESEIEFLSCCF